MKDNWEKHKPTFELSKADLNTIIHGYDPSLTVNDVHLLTGGLSHTNYKVSFKNQTEPLVVRMTDNKKNLKMEHNLHRLINQSTAIPVPEFLYLDEQDRYSAGILEWKSGILLKDRMLTGGSEENRALGFSAGCHLASFRNVTFKEYGSLDEHLKVFENFRLTPDSFIEFIHYFTEGKPAQWLEVGLIEKITAYAAEKAPLFSEDDSRPALVHADYNGLNILVENNKISAILDWEFALSGSIYMDIGNMLRYDSLPHYASFEKGFIEGIQKGGVQLSPYWRQLAKLTDLISLLSMLDNDFGGINRLRDLNYLISMTVEA